MQRSADAVIIGAGIIGCAIALELCRNGYKTLNVDRLPSPGFGSTAYSAGIIRPYYSTHEGTALALEGHYSWQRWVAEQSADSPAILRYLECGCIVLKTRENGDLQSTRRILSEANVPFDDLDRETLTRHLPAPDLRSFSPVRRIDDPAFGEANEAGISGAIFCPTGGYISDPQLACRQLASAATNAGGAFQFNSTVTQILSDSGRIRGVEINGAQQIHAPVVVNAAGPYSSGVNSMSRALTPSDIRTKPVRQEVAHLASPRSADGHALNCVLTDSDCGVYLRPDANQHVLIGSLEPPCDAIEVVDAAHYDENLTDQWANQVWRAALRFPHLGIPNQSRGFAALYDVSDDWIPVYDKSAIDGYFMAIGTSGNQFKNALVVGNFMAQLIEHCMAGNDHDAQPLEYCLPLTRRALNLGAFSRQRAVDARSSFSVLA